MIEHIFESYAIVELMGRNSLRVSCPSKTSVAPRLSG